MNDVTPLAEDEVYNLENGKLLPLQSEFSEGIERANAIHGCLDQSGNSAAVARKNADAITEKLIADPKCDLHSSDFSESARASFFAQIKRNGLLKIAVKTQQKAVDAAASAAGRRAAALVESAHESAVRKVVFAFFRLSDLLAEEEGIRESLREAGHNGNWLVSMPCHRADIRRLGSSGDSYLHQSVVNGFVSLADLKKYLTPKKLNDLAMTTKSSRERILGFDESAKQEKQNV